MLAPLEQCAQGFARRALRGIELEGQAVVVRGLVRLLEGTLQQAPPLRQQGDPLAARARALDARVEKLQRRRVQPQSFAERHGSLERRRVMGLELEHAPRVQQRVVGSLEFVGQQLRELEPDRDLVGSGEVGEFGFEQARQRLGLSVLAVDLSQRRLHRPIVRPVREGLAVGFGGVAGEIAAQEGVAQPHQPVGALLAFLGAATQLDQVERVAGALVAVGQRLGHERGRPRVAERHLEGGDGALYVVELGLAHPGDLHAQRRALALLLASIPVPRGLQRREPPLEHAQQCLGAILGLIAFDQVVGGRRVRGIQLEEPLEVFLGQLGSAGQLGVDARQAPAQGQLPRRVHARLELEFQGADQVVGAVLLLVALREHAPHVRARRIELDDALEVGDLSGRVAQAAPAQLRQALVQALVFFLAGPPERALQVLAQRAPLAGGLEDALVTQRRVEAQLRVRRGAGELLVDLLGFVGSIEQLFEDHRALEQGAIAGHVVRRCGGLFGQEVR